jgi:WXXGXW repeat (2 copies)
MRQQILAGAFLMAGSFLSACGHPYGAYYVQEGPPPPRYAVVGAAPGPGFVWTSGYWDRRGGSWAWVEGRWMRPPRPHAVWVAPEWHHEGRGWHFHPGRWR